MFEPKPAIEYVTCETLAAYVVHIREVGEIPIRYGGHWPRPRSLCDAEISWDMQIPVSAAGCQSCKKKYAERTKP